MPRSDPVIGAAGFHRRFDTASTYLRGRASPGRWRYRTPRPRNPPRLCRRPAAAASGVRICRPHCRGRRVRRPRPRDWTRLSSSRPLRWRRPTFAFRSTSRPRLRLSDARPLIVAAAQASVWVAEAELTRAKVLWVPTLNIGFDYLRHDGGGPDFNKGIMTAPSVNFFYGGGGLIQNVATTDVIFQPLVARQNLTSMQADIQTAKNDSLSMTADAYFQVHQFRGMYTGALYAIERGHDLIERISQLSKELVPKVEVDRARNFVADLEQQATSAREAWRVHSANLTQILRLDPRAVVVPLEHDHLQITLIDPNRSYDDLMPIALTNRPELDIAGSAGRGGDECGPPGEDAPAHAADLDQRLSDAQRAHPGRYVRPRPQQHHEPVGRPCRREPSAPLAARRAWESATWRESRRSAACSRWRSSIFTGSRTWWRPK